MKNPLVSVIIPYYKKIQFFKNTYNSVISQNYKNLEIIIIYDDINKSELLNLKKIIKNKNIKFIINKNNIGAGNSRNKGIKVSKGKYIAFIDSDDIWHRNKIAKQVKIMESNKYMFTHCSYKIINSNNKVVGIRKAKKLLNFNQLLKSCDIGLSTVVINKKILKNLKFPSLKTKEDYVLWLTLSKKVPIIGLDQQLVFWRKTKNSLSSSVIQKMIDGYSVYRKYMKFSILKSISYLAILSLNYIFKYFNKKHI